VFHLLLKKNAQSHAVQAQAQKKKRAAENDANSWKAKSARTQTKLETAQQQLADQDQDGQPGRCTVCQDAYRDIVLDPCGHLAHQACQNLWVKSHPDDEVFCFDCKTPTKGSFKVFV
jgi:hypothetical protein